MSRNLQIYISPAPEAGQNPSIPFLIEGDSDAYSVRTHAPSGARYESGTVHFGNEDFVTLEFRSRRDADNDNDTVEFTIDEANLPDGYYLGTNSSWEATIIDNRKRSIFFHLPHASHTIDHLGAANLTPRVGDIISVRVRVSPPGLTITLGKCRVTCVPGPLEVFDGRGESVYLSDHGREHVSIVSWRLSAEEMNVQVTPSKPGFYSLWIRDVPDGTIIGDNHRVNFRIQ